MKIQELIETKQRLDPKCWKGYKKQGTKMKGDTRVNNCVPESAEQGVAEAGFPGAPDVEMPPMKPSGDLERDKLKQEYVDIHHEIKSLVDIPYRSDSSPEQKMQARARIKQLNDRADQIKAILEPRQPPNEWQKKTYGFDDNWNKVNQGVAEGADDKFSVYDKVEELVNQYKLFDKRGWTDLFSRLAGRKLEVAEIRREMEYASKFLQLLDSIRMRSDYRGQQDPKEDQELIDLSNQWLSLFNKATGEFKGMSSQGVAEGLDAGQKKARQVPGTEMPKKTSPVLGKAPKQHPFKGRAVGDGL